MGGSMGVRRTRLDMRMADQKLSRKENGVLKVKETARRDKRILEILKKNPKLPQIPSVMSWLSAKLDRPSRLITQQDLDAFLAK